MSYLKKKIMERKKYNEGLKKIIEEPNLYPSRFFSKEYNSICKNTPLSKISKIYYLNGLKALQLYSDVIYPCMKLMIYMWGERITKCDDFIFKNDFDILPISFSELYELLISLPTDGVERILCKMNICGRTMNKLLSAMEKKSQSDFVSSLESEPNDLTHVCKQIRFFEMDYHFVFSLIDKFNNNEVVDFEEVMIGSSLLDKYFTELELTNSLIESKEIWEIFKELMNMTPEEYTNKIENSISQGLRPRYFFDYSKRGFILIYLVITLLDPLSKEEQECLNEIFNKNEKFQDVIKLAKRYVNWIKTKIDKEEVEFIIPDDFFSNKMYITGSKEDEWIFSIQLRPTDDNNKKKVQALQTFINTIAENGYTEDNFHTKATFLYRMTGRKLPNTKPGVITWRDEMKNYNCFCYLVKNFEHDFLCQSKGNTRKGLYEKAQGFFGITGKIENPSAKANDIQKTKFIKYYEQFKKDMK